MCNLSNFLLFLTVCKILCLLFSTNISDLATFIVAKYNVHTWQLCTCWMNHNICGYIFCSGSEYQVMFSLKKLADFL